MNEWLDMFGLSSIWDDHEWPVIEPYPNKEIKNNVEDEIVVDTESYMLQQKIKEQLR